MKSILLTSLLILSAHFAKAQVCVTEPCNAEMNTQYAPGYYDENGAFVYDEVTTSDGSYYGEENFDMNTFPPPPPHQPGPQPGPQPPQPGPHPGPGPQPGPHPGPGPGPHPGPMPPPHQPPVNRDEYIRCNSSHYSYHECGFNPYGVRSIRLVQVHSTSACIAGQSYGFYSDRIWVNRGCQATFLIDRR